MSRKFFIFFLVNSVFNNIIKKTTLAITKIASKKTISGGNIKTNFGETKKKNRNKNNQSIKKTVRI